MLLWERLNALRAERERASRGGDQPAPRAVQRLPFDKRCAAVTKSGRRCRGKVRNGSEYCPFHDPEVSRERRRAIAAKGGKSRRRLAYLPDGYLRKLNNPAAVGEAMDRLYREVRLGAVAPEMGGVLLEILTRILRQLDESAGRPKGGARPRKADRLEPKLRELITQAEQASWRTAHGRGSRQLAGDGSAARAASGGQDGPAAGSPSSADGKRNALALTHAS